MSSLGAHLLETLDSGDLVELARRLGPLLPQPPAPRVDEDWLTTADTADYLGLSRSQINKLCAAREIPFEQEAPGHRCWFKRDQLDDWRRGELRR